ncbi:MAG: hypothetical protein IPM35_16600 [Myxococcales bacterium]|nr:hypothetical protein [Myxococcales bacterium]
MVGTRLEVPFGQSPFAFRRGNRFEDRLRLNGHAPLRGLLTKELGVSFASARVADLRQGYPKNRAGLQQRAVETERLITQIVKGSMGAPNLIDGAVMMRAIGGIPAYFEADAVAAYMNGPIHAGEVKSFPTVDGQADADKVGAAVAQVSIYVLLLRDHVARLGGNPDVVSQRALLITALNTGLQPTITSVAIGREIDRADRILKQAPSLVAIASALPAKLPTFGEVRKLPTEQARIDAADCLADQVGTKFGPGCLSSCGLSKLCRERAHRAGDPARVGPQLVRLLPNVASVDRAAALARGATPQNGEAPVAAELVRAKRLLGELVKAATSARSAGGRR